MESPVNLEDEHHAPIPPSTIALAKHSTPKFGRADSGYLSATPNDTPPASTSRADQRQLNCETPQIKHRLIKPTYLRRYWSEDGTKSLDLGVFKEDRVYVDIIRKLREYNLLHIISTIFSFLSPSDLRVVANVSRTWRQACIEDRNANIRRIAHLQEVEKEKENMPRRLQFCLKKQRSEGCILGQIQISRLENGERDVDSEDCETPVHPRTRFDEFLKESESLSKEEELRKCLRCSGPALYLKAANEAFCKRKLCGFRFCTICLLSAHGSQPCQTRERYVPCRKAASVGSKRSKKNLKRM